MFDTINCPKCDHHHEPFGSYEDDAGQWTCDGCGFRFIVEIEYDPSYSTTCAEHDFQEGRIPGSPIPCRICSICGWCRAEI